jgi:hypothetical protein
MELELIIKDWKALVKEGKGYFEVFQETWAHFGDVYTPFGKWENKYRNLGKGAKVGINEWVRLQDHIISHFGLYKNYFDNRIEHKNQDQYAGELFVEVRKTGGKTGRLLIYGWTIRDIGGRLGVSYLAVEGNYDTLKRTYNLFQKDPTKIRNFTKEVFGWKNVPSYKGNGHLEPPQQLDILTYTKRIYFLDAGNGYGFIKKFQIRNYNPDVKKVTLRSQ